MNKLLTGMVTIVISCILIIGFRPVYAASIDVYLVYSSADKDIKSQLNEKLPADLKVKSYNATLLTMADYSGKQKAVAKLSGARVVVLINEQVVEILGNPDFKVSLIINGSGDDNVEKILAQLR